MECRICGSPSQRCFEGKVLSKYLVSYYHCPRCGFLSTEEPYWLDEAYADPINIYDTGVMRRSIIQSKRVGVILSNCFDQYGKFIDYGGGYGVFTRMMRDVGFDFYWYDPYCTNLMARGFEYDGESNISFEALTSFETFEHFPHPMEDIERMVKLSKNILFSTELLPQPVPKPNSWWYYGLEHGQHISFYSEATLRFIADKIGKHFSSVCGIRMFTERRVNTRKVQTIISLTEKLQLPSLSGLKSRTEADMRVLQSKGMGEL
jgi:hypothetical protein